MAFFLVQGGASLYKVDPGTGTATALSLPTGVTLSTTRKPKFAVLNQFVVMVNSPTQNLCIDPEGTVRVLVPRAPISPPLAAAGGGTGLSGTFKVRVSFYVTDTEGNIIMESALSPASQPVTIANKDLALTRIPISQDAVSGRRVYRNATNGSQYYQWVDLDGNVSTTIQSNLSDAALATLPVIPTILLSPPGTLANVRMKNICSWRSRFWGVSDDPALVDTVVYTEVDKVYAWPNSLNAFPKGVDSAGIVGFAPRRDQLGVMKRNGVWQITGDTSANFKIVQIAFDAAGCIAEDTIVMVNDRVYWLGNDGVYEWSSDGVKNISDDSVDPWFTSDTYFNRSRFGSAFARYNKVRDSVEFHLAAAGSSVEDRWVSYNRTNKKWYGPHKTGLFTPSHAGWGVDSNNLPICLVGGTDGIVYVANSANKRDGAATAIDMDVFGRFHHGDSPDSFHHWGEPSLFTRIETGGTLDVIPYLGGLDAAAGTTISANLTLGRERLRRLGDARLAMLRFRKNVVNEGATLMGYEIPFFEIGRR